MYVPAGKKMNGVREKRLLLHTGCARAHTQPKTRHPASEADDQRANESTEHRQKCATSKGMFFALRTVSAVAVVAVRVANGWNAPWTRSMYFPMMKGCTWQGRTCLVPGYYFVLSFYTTLMNGSRGNP